MIFQLRNKHSHSDKFFGFVLVEDEKGIQFFNWNSQATYEFQPKEKKWLKVSHENLRALEGGFEKLPSIKLRSNELQIGGAFHSTTTTVEWGPTGRTNDWWFRITHQKTGKQIACPEGSAAIRD